MIRGMTGFAEKSYATKSLRLKISIRTLNHRFFDWTMKGTPLGEVESRLRSITQKRIRRGRVEAHVEIVSLDPGSWEFTINEGLLEKIFSSLDSVSRKTGRRLEFPPENLFRIPQLVEIARKKLGPEELGFLERSFEQTLSRVVLMRRTEGRDTARVLKGHIRRIRESVRRIERRFKSQPALVREKLKLRVREINQGTSFTEERLAEEAAYLAQRYDLAEEIARLKAHLATFERLLSSRLTEPAGKQMDFLAQELHREANTLNSKSQDIHITEESLGVKNEVESIRQHVQNIE